MRESACGSLASCRGVASLLGAKLRLLQAYHLADSTWCAQTAGDIAFSMNHDRAYEELLAEGIRAEMLRSVLESAASSSDAEDPSAMAVDAEPSTSDAPKLSTASDNATFLSSRLIFTADSRGQAVALDAEGNGVMMNWEEGIMRRTVEALAREGGWEGRKGRRREELVSEEERGEREGLKVLNVGFGLGIVSLRAGARAVGVSSRRAVADWLLPRARSLLSPSPSQIDTHLQSYAPTTHLIIEPHPDVLSFARQNGWFDKPGVRFYEGTWKQWMGDLESGTEEYEGWDAVYFGESARVCLSVGRSRVARSWCLSGRVRLD